MYNENRIKKYFLIIRHNWYQNNTYIVRGINNMKRNFIEVENMPTIQEIKENFNDFTKEPLPLSNEQLNDNNLPLYKRVKHTLSHFLWQDLTRMKRTAPETCYTNDDPVEVFLNFIREYIARAVVKLDEEGIAVQIIDEFNKNRNPNISDDDYASRAVKMIMEVSNMQDVIKITKQIPDALDFNENKITNYPKINFNRKWNAKLRVEQWDADGENNIKAEGYNVDMKEQTDSDAFNAACISDFMAKLTPQDKQLFMMRLQGKSYEDIAVALGYSDHTGVIKRMRKVGKEFEEQTGIHCGFSVKKAKSSYNRTINK